MSRDYAHRGAGARRPARRRPAKAKPRTAVPGWIWLVAGLSVGLAVAAFVYISRPTAPADEPAASAGSTSKPQAKPEAIKLPPAEKPRFTFYEILRDQEVVVPNEQAHSATPPPPPDRKSGSPAAAADGRYVIQVASFRSQTEADRQKASLALIGIESRIESVTIDGKTTYYRVRIGPESDWRQVQTTMARLEDNGIEPMLIKLR